LTVAARRVVTPVPAPTPSPQPAATATTTAALATSEREVEEEAPHWDAVAETEGKGVLSGSHSHRQNQGLPTVATRLWLWIGLGSVVVVVLLVVLYAMFSSGPPKPPPVDQPKQIVVDLKGTDSTTERSVYAAWRAARNGDKILLRSGTEEVFSLIGTTRKNITIEAESGYDVVWKAPATFPNNPSVKTMLWLEDLDGVVFRGITFDGEKADLLVSLFGSCPGVRFERCSFINFHKAAIWISNAEGEKARPIEINNCTFKTPDKTGAAVFFNIKNNPGWRPKNRFITLKDLAGDPDVRLKTPNPEFNEEITLPPGVTITRSN
jgi:hypothetical protein